MTIADPVDIELLNRESGGAGSWTLPTWGNPLSDRVLLLCTYQDSLVIPVGTGFSISPIGMCATGVHVIDEAFPEYKSASRVGLDPRIKSSLGAARGGEQLAGCLAAISIPPPNSGPVKFGDPGMVAVVEPTDIGLISFSRAVPEQQSQQWEAFPISPMMPKIGSTVYCVGYCEFDSTSKLTTSELFSYDRQTIEQVLKANFRVTKGEVTHVYTQKYADGFGSGACFRVSCPLKHGQSGGPVFNSDGYVCGVNMSSTLDSPQDSSLVSALWEALGGVVKLPDIMVANYAKYKIPQEVTLMSLIKNGCVISDGSEKHRIEISRNGQLAIMPPEAVVKLYQRTGMAIPDELEQLRDLDIPDGVFSNFAESISQ